MTTLATDSDLPKSLAWADRRLLIWVTTLSKKEVFSPDVGEGVATGVSASEPVDARQIARTTRWGFVPTSVNEARLRARRPTAN
jgi:hypothetical protein